MACRKSGRLELEQVVYGFCVRLCTDFLHVVWLLRTFTAFVRVERLSVRIRLIFCDVRWGQSREIQSCGFFNFFCPCERSLFLDSLEDMILRVPPISLSARASRFYWKVSSIQFWGFCKSLCPRKLLVIHPPILSRRFLVGLNREIYFPGGVIFMCTMLLCGSYVNVGTKGTSGVIMIS